MSVASFLFAAKKIVSVFLAPPAMPVLLTIAGLLLIPRKPRLGKSLAWSGLLIWIFLSTPATVDLIAAPLESYHAISAEQLGNAQAIVILAGGMKHYNEEYAGAPVSNRITLERLRYGARLAKQTKLPVLVSGGPPGGAFSEGSQMADALKVDFGVAPRWLEVRSLDTADNARYSAEILKPAGISRIVLVTHASHMRRAVAEFEAVGLQVAPAPTSFFSGPPSGGETFLDYLPNMSSAYEGWYVMHEWLGILAQKIRFAAQ